MSEQKNNVNHNYQTTFQTFIIQQVVFYKYWY